MDYILITLPHTLSQTFTTLLHTPIKYGLYMYMHTTELTEWCTQNGMISSCVPLQSDWLYCTHWYVLVTATTIISQNMQLYHCVSSPWVADWMHWKTSEGCWAGLANEGGKGGDVTVAIMNREVKCNLASTSPWNWMVLDSAGSYTKHLSLITILGSKFIINF